MDEDFRTVGRLLRDAERVLFITGAGVSAESGIPTFRGSTAAFADGLTEEGLRFEDVLSGPTFRAKPQLSWKYFFLLEQFLRGRKPGAAHQAIAALEQPGRFVCVATQNIDGLHQSAGSKCVIELHGNLRRLVCTGCDYCSTPETFIDLEPLPRCPNCGAILRPDAVLYEELLPEEALEQLELERSRRFDLVFSVGTTSVFQYVTEPVLTAAYRGIPTVEINPEETPLSDVVRFRFAGQAGQTLQKILAAT